MDQQGMLYRNDQATLSGLIGRIEVGRRRPAHFRSDFLCSFVLLSFVQLFICSIVLLFLVHLFNKKSPVRGFFII